MALSILHEERERCRCHYRAAQKVPEQAAGGGGGGGLLHLGQLCVTCEGPCLVLGGQFGTSE